MQLVTVAERGFEAECETKGEESAFGGDGVNGGSLLTEYQK